MVGNNSEQKITKNYTDEKFIKEKEFIKKFQIYLRKYENNQELVIETGEAEVGTKHGDGSTSILFRVKLTGKRGDGKSYNKTLIWKRFTEDTAIAKKVNLNALFCQEQRMYKKILSVLERFAPKCIHADAKNIIMEDLAQQKYSLCQRRNFLDLKHTAYALKTLARFHASALAVKIQNTELFNEWISSLKEVIYTDDPKIRICTNDVVETTINNLEKIKPLTRELKDITKYLKTYGNPYDRMYALFNAPKHKYHTICHGDMWTNNMLFLHDDEGEIIDMKMVDFQICRHNSVASDILYLIYTSVQTSLIEKSYESLVSIYHNEFIGELGRLQVGEEILKELSMEWLNKELQMFSFYGANIGCYFINVGLAEKEDSLQFESEAFHKDINEKKLNRLKCILLHHYRRYVLGIVKEDLEPIS